MSTQREDRPPREKLGGFSFLTARWVNLASLTWAVPREILSDYLPAGLSLDTHPAYPSQAFISLVAFEFLDTRVMGIAWPGYRNFPEINLRFYVQREGTGERGVVFIREFVPQKVTAFLARVCYNEPYLVAPMTAHLTRSDTQVTVEHRLTFGGRTHTLTITGSTPPILHPEDSLEHFFKEQAWGFGRSRRGKCTRYEVRHPRWECYPVLSYRCDFDFERVYGNAFAILGKFTPIAATLAAGSSIRVQPYRSM